MNMIAPPRDFMRPRPTALDFLRGKTVLVTGVCGTVGRHLAHRLLEKFEVGSLIGLDHNETELAFLEEEHSRRDNVRFRLADMRDLSAVLRESRRVDVLFHAAAYKHVNVCERSPLEAIQTNVIGVQNIIQATLDNDVGRLVFTSSDKAVNPTNVMGTSKLMGERLITASATEAAHTGSSLLSTRFGNVLGSRGSVIPIFCEQIRKGGPITLTDPEMTRFIMSLENAVDLVIESMVLGQSGDVLITKMPVIRIVDLAEVMIREYAPRFGYRPEDVQIKVVGPRPGEKMYEELMNDEETRRAFELEKYYVVRPAATVHAQDNSGDYQGLVNRSVVQAYNSQNVKPLTQTELRNFLIESQLINPERRAPRTPWKVKHTSKPRTMA